MRFPSPSHWLVGAIAAVAINAAGAANAVAQVPLSTLDDVRREVAAGDVVTIVRSIGEPTTGRLLRFGSTDLDIRTEAVGATGERLVVMIPLTDLKSLERPRDSSRNGALIGAGVGGGVALGMFVYAAAIDYNDIDEWGPTYLAIGGIFSGVGAVAGWAIDRAHSKPHIRFNAAPTGSVRIHLAPWRGRGARIVVAVDY